MTLSRLKWIGIAILIVFIVGFEYLTHFVLHAQILSDEQLYLLVVAVVTVVIVLFFQALFATIQRLQDHVAHEKEGTAEREKITREVRDELAQVLGLVDARIQAAEVMIAAGQTKQALQALERARQVSWEGYGEIREELPTIDTDALLEQWNQSVQIEQERQPGELSEDQDGVEPLTSREVEVLRLVAKGYPNLQIAREMNLSQHTVRFHLRNIMTKLHAQSRTEAATRALEKGLI